jgi:hypothetical protein
MTGVVGNALIRKELMTRFVHATHSSRGPRPLPLLKSLESSTEIDFKIIFSNERRDYLSYGFY